MLVEAVGVGVVTTDDDDDVADIDELEVDPARFSLFVRAANTELELAILVRGAGPSLLLLLILLLVAPLLLLLL